MPWTQIYDPTGSPVLSTILAAAPLVVLLGTLGLLGWSAPRAAASGLFTALVVAICVYGMPWQTAVASATYGACFGLFPIGWIVVSAVFLYLLTVESGEFEIVKSSVVALSPDHRIQALLIAFCFGAFVEGAAGFGTPVAISGALLMGAGFPPLEAAGLTLIANTAPVAFGALGTPIVTLAKVTGLPEMQLSAMAGRQLPLFSFIIPAWIVITMSGWKGLRGVWPAVLVSGGTFAVVQFVVSNYLGPALTDVAGGIISMLVLALLLTVWRPRAMAVRTHQRRSNCKMRQPESEQELLGEGNRSGVGSVVDPVTVRFSLGTAAVSYDPRWWQAGCRPALVGATKLFPASANDNVTCPTCISMVQARRPLHRRREEVRRPLNFDSTGSVPREQGFS